MLCMFRGVYIRFVLLGLKLTKHPTTTTRTTTTTTTTTNRKQKKRKRKRKRKRKQKTKQMHVIVVGGGLSGLSAAHTVLNGGVRVTLLEKNAFLGGNSTKATSGINGAGSRTQAKVGIDDSVDVFPEDTVRSATGVKDGPMPPPYPLAKVIAESPPARCTGFRTTLGLLWIPCRGWEDIQGSARTDRGQEASFPGMEITSALMKSMKCSPIRRADHATLSSMRLQRP